jgi:GWxTD domain-containing protein
MRRWMLVAGLAAIMALAPSAGAAQSEDGVRVRAFRFYRAESGQTLVTAFVEVPYLLLQAPADGSSAELKYGVVVSISDSSGVQLNKASWPGRARADLRRPGAVALEILDFSLAPGKFQIRVTVTDSTTGKSYSSSQDVVAWSTPPGASDLLLSPSMRLATGSDTMPHAGERRWGNTMVTPATRLRLTPIRSKAFYLVEAYAPSADSGTMSVRVSDSTGKVLVQTRPTRVDIAPGGSVLKGQLDLAGLPAGDYTMTVHLDIGGHAEDRSDQFVMADFQQTMEREESRLEALKVTDEGYFGTMTEDQLDAAEAPLLYIASSDSLAVWKSGLSVAAKRQFLTRFWQQRDPTPGTPKNELREAFYNAIDEADRRYTEGGRAATPGWRTDRGRIFVKYGEPGDQLDRRVSTGTAPPYLVWRYFRGKGTYYIFVDRTGFGGYQLIATNDIKETGAPGYREILGGEALQDISRWLGVDLFAGGNVLPPTN